jgi:hypothetical protein
VLGFGVFFSIVTSVLVFVRAHTLALSMPSRTASAVLHHRVALVSSDSFTRPATPQLEGKFGHVKMTSEHFNTAGRDVKTGLTASVSLNHIAPTSTPTPTPAPLTQAPPSQPPNLYPTPTPILIPVPVPSRSRCRCRGFCLTAAPPWHPAQVIVSQWTWAATLLQSSNVAWNFGISGPFWYAAGASIQVPSPCHFLVISLPPP